MTNTETTQKNIQTISINELQEKLAREGNLQFWNVLTNEYFSGEMIPGSRRVALDQIGREVNNSGLSKDTEIVVYCAGPTCPQSAMAAQKLTDLGFTNARAFEGGLEEWKGNGLEVETQSQSAVAA